MRKTDIVTLVAGVLFALCSCAAIAENTRPPSVGQDTSKTETPEKAVKSAPDDSSLNRQKARKQPKQSRNTAPKASRKSSKPSPPEFDEKSLGLGCSKP